ncbi:Ig-like V-type domain-containing protein FAM187A [Haliotis rufescens]|uniref:Ig-like V-type domain-containing protein FAM187A n=1 Tax=Haliotis rufescens TaxID=6454 RepID=UPI001EAFC370|nr:Ig-like V-type domain-containing protein FAM187A [Haliotis rufescens]
MLPKQQKRSMNIFFPFTIVTLLTVAESKTLADDGSKTMDWRTKISKARERTRRAVGSEWKMSRSEAKEMFQQYYKCLREKLKILKYQKQSITPIISHIGQTVKLKCLICVRPDQMDSQMVSWQFLKRADATISVLDAGKHLRITKQWTLVIKELGMADVGQYFCVEGGEYMAVYQLDVLTAETRKVVLEKDKGNLLPTVALYKSNLKLLTSWTEWSQCNHCGKPGLRRKIGLCMVKKIWAGQTTKPFDFPLLALYKDGVPCRSTALPKAISRLPGIAKRPSEVLLGNCQVPCPTQPPPLNITDATGKVVEVIEPGFYSIKTHPKLPPIVKRIVQYHEAGIHLVLKCPSDEDDEGDDNSIVRWQRGKRQIDPLSIKKQTRGRVFVDQENKLHMRRLFTSDTAPYNCWILKRHVATIKVIVIEKFDANLKDYISYGGFILTAIAVVLVCLCVCCRRGQKTAR